MTTVGERGRWGFAATFWGTDGRRGRVQCAAAFKKSSFLTLCVHATKDSIFRLNETVSILMPMV